ncbi:PREDICTED: cell adhesion molecule-related/down-regulated by oncogenes-like [Branchiostoma belcheri]|uniref:Cell adhesion molecule-related/down-regulated by oncogenes-like n=1 Tax=Branchiostoma belcheri TaxID=7741 RepID=A0A6P4XYB7_BRABE|nr:PREDICTED: cell adhesion molecule-related/down-regulated by oncogenes-like [Branchiostoma belcheri]
MYPYRRYAIQLVVVLSMAMKVNAASYRSKPQPTSVLLGGSATLSCGFDGLEENEAVHWLGPPNLHYISEGTSVSGKYPRMFITGEGNSGDTTGVYNLNIRDVRLEDEGVYRCSTFSLKDPEDVKLTVIVPPVRPPIIMERFASPRVAGQSLQLTCRSEGGRPLPSLAWYNGTTRHSRFAHAAGSVDNDMIEYDMYVPFLTKWDNGINMTCVADQGLPSLVMPQRTSITMNVLYPPSIQKTFDEKVNVLYDSEEEFFLECKADGNPTPRVRWRRKNTDLYFNNPLRFSRLDYQTEGTYECVADSLAFSESVKEAVIDVIGRPDIRGDPETAHATQGSSVTLLCEVTSDPPPDSIIWSWRNPEGREITLTGGSVDGLTIRGKTTDDYTESLMILDHVSSASSGDYICKATNMFGSDSREFRVIVTGPPVIMIAVVTGVLVVSILLTLVAIIFIIRRKDLICGKKEKGKDCKDGQPKQVNLEPSDINLDVLEAATKPLPPPRMAKDPYAIGISYPRRCLAVPAHSYPTSDRGSRSECKHQSPHKYRHKGSRPQEEIEKIEREYRAPRWQLLSERKDVHQYDDAVGEFEDYHGVGRY